MRESLGGKGHRPDFLVITAARDMGSVRAAMQLGTVHYLVKPFTFAQLEERLAAYRDLRGRIERIDEAEQHDVDTLYGLLRGPAPLPKGQSGPTMARIRELLHASPDDLSAADIAEHVGISRSTAQRYLAELARQGKIELHLHYGAAGRPGASLPDGDHRQLGGHQSSSDRSARSDRHRRGPSRDHDLPLFARRAYLTGVVTSLDGGLSGGG